MKHNSIAPLKGGIFMAISHVDPSLLNEEIPEEELRYYEAIKKCQKRRKAKLFDDCSYENIIEKERVFGYL